MQTMYDLVRIQADRTPDALALVDEPAHPGRQRHRYFPELDTYNTGAGGYLDLLTAAKKELSIPVIASLNGDSFGGWTLYARILQDRGADALELNIYHIAADADVSGSAVEAMYLKLVESVRDAIEIPFERDGCAYVLIDTAGRLQSKKNLMDELSKVRRVISRRDETAPHEIMLVLDASQGQNALVQAEKFHEALGLTGLTVTKLDGSAKGGILLAIADRIGVPVRFIGIGEAAEDMQPFSAEEFADALVSSGQQDQAAT